jgi:Short C-terminal domain
MPGLIRGVARVAVASGTATAVSNRVSRRQADRWAQQAPPQQQAPSYQEAPLPAVDPVEQLAKLGELRDSGVLTEEEFATQKAKILG